MKALLTLAVVSLLFVVLTPQASAMTADAALGVAGLAQSFDAPTCLAGGAQAGPQFLQSVETGWGPPPLPSCRNLDGASCSNPGGLPVRCMWQAWEPGICVCQSNSIYLCG